MGHPVAEQPAADAADEGQAPDGLSDGYSRFELELEFVQCLANPLYLNYLATLKLLESEQFIAYLAYLQYFASPEYCKYLTYPGPTLKALELLQQERFRHDIIMPETVQRLIDAIVTSKVDDKPAESRP